MERDSNQGEHAQRAEDDRDGPRTMRTQGNESHPGPFRRGDQFGLIEHIRARHPINNLDQLATMPDGTDDHEMAVLLPFHEYNHRAIDGIRNRAQPNSLEGKT